MADQDFIIEKFSSYKVFLHKDKAAININLPSGKAILRFTSKDLPANKVTEIEDRRQYELFLERDMYMAHIDLLRHEKPLYFAFSFIDNNGYITTSDEPVGEAE